MKILNIIIIAAVILSLALSILNFTKTPKIAYIDSSILMDNFKPAIEAREKLSALQEEWDKNLKTLEDELNKMNQEIIDNNSKWSKKTKSEKYSAIEKKNMEYRKYRSAIEEKAQAKEQDIMQPVFDNINLLLQKYGDNKKYSIIYGTVAGGNILYGDNTVNITNEFLMFANSVE